MKNNKQLNESCVHISTDDADYKLSQLFQLKVNTELPSDQFWARFDEKLTQKINIYQHQQEQKQPSVWMKYWYAFNNFWLSYRRQVVHAATVCACGMVLTMSFFSKYHAKIHTSGNGLSSRELAMSTFAIDEIDNACNWKDTTVCINNHSYNFSKYAQDNVSAQGWGKVYTEWSF